MIPKGSQAIGHLVTRIAMDLIPKAADAYMATDLGYFTILMTMVGQDYDRAADVHVTEDAEISAILREAAPHLAEGTLKTRIADTLGEKPASLKMAELNARSDKLLKLLIDVHAAVEDAKAAGAAWAGKLDDTIWRFLDAHVVRHAYEVPL